MDVTEIGSVRRHRKRVLLAAGLAITVTLAAGGLLVKLAPELLGGTRPAGDELAKMNPYGWSASMAVGTRFTDGLNFMPIAPTAQGTIRLLSVTPIMDGGPALKVLGVLARVTPDMLPPNFETGWFEWAHDFPPTDYDAGGGVDPIGFVVPVSPRDQQVDLELQIGYEVVATGKSNKRGVKVRYEYEGRVHEVVVPSHLSICAPVTAKCVAEDG
jgi:hypothetical protein